MRYIFGLTLILLASQTPLRPCRPEHLDHNRSISLCFCVRGGAGVLTETLPILTEISDLPSTGLIIPAAFCERVNNAVLVLRLGGVIWFIRAPWKICYVG